MAERREKTEAETIRWFVMVVDGERGGPLAISDENEKPHLFDTEEEAHRQGAMNPVGHAYGYEVYAWPWQPKGED